MSEKELGYPARLIIPIYRARVFEREVEKNKEKTKKKIRIDDNTHSWYQMELHENSFHDDFIIIISIEYLSNSMER